MRSFATSLAVRQTLIAALLLAALFWFSFLLTRRFLWRGLKVVAISEHARMMETLGEDTFTLSPEEMSERLRTLRPGPPPHFYVEWMLEGHGHIHSTPNVRGATLIDPRRTDNVYRIQVGGQGEFFVHTFRDGPLTVRIAQDLDTTKIVLGAYTRASLVLFVAVLGLNGFLIWWAAHQALRPVRAMQIGAERISSENLGERIAVSSVKDEISRLAALLNRTFDRLQSSFEQIKRFTADASHELKTPLTVARAQAEKLLRPDLTPEAHEEATHGVLGELTQLEQIIEDLLLLARSDAHALPFAPAELSTADFWEEVLPEVQALAEYHGIGLRTTHRREGRARVDRRWVRHVVLNLVNNAIRHSPTGATMTVASSVEDGCWHVTIEDEGPGVPPDKLEKIFDRFYQVRPDEKQFMEGTGLGLAICRSLVQMHQGCLRAENCAPGHGLRVVIELPVSTGGASKRVV